MSKFQQKKDDVIFRRVRGRIVPISIKKSKGGLKAVKTRKRRKELKEAASLITLGTGIAGLSGVIGGVIAKKTTRLAQMAIKLSRSTPRAAESARAASALSRSIVAKGQRRIKLAKNIGILGTEVLGATMVASGVHRLFTEQQRKNMGLTDDIISQATGVGVALVARKGARIGFKKASAAPIPQLKFPGL